MRKLLKIDPIYWVLRLLHLIFTLAPLEAHERAFVEDNVLKHQIVTWVTIGAAYLVHRGLREVPQSAIGIIIAALAGPAILLGAAWFTVSLGAIPEKLRSVGMLITGSMFASFMVALVTMFMSTMYITPAPINIVLALVFAGIVISGILYDTADGLKVGLDEAVLRHSRYAVSFYRKQGIKETER